MDKMLAWIEAQPKNKFLPLKYITINKLKESDDILFGRYKIKIAYFLDGIKIVVDTKKK